jgi:hypothetical protein
MSEQEVIDLMVKSVNDDNRELCDRMGMSKEETEESIEKSYATISMMMANLHSRMKEANLLA